MINFIQRGKGVFGASIRGLQRLNALGYGLDDGARKLSLVYNPQGPSLPPAQNTLEADYKRELMDAFGVSFTQLYSLANLPIGRFGSILVSKGQFDGYMELLKSAHQPENMKHVMCRSLISIDWQGYVYDCDFNQMLGIGKRLSDNGGLVHLRELLDVRLDGDAIAVRSHCFACTAGQGSSCGGALAS